ncbi:MAG: peptide chain release factor 1 [Rhodobacteraceae bacterium]|nr:peptide chain release factor 1 [Paracoccaceae bacterium]
MIPQDTTDQIIDRFQFLEAKLASGASGQEIVSLSREYAELNPVVDKINGWRALVEDYASTQELMSDPEMRELAAEELPLLKTQLAEAEAALQLALLPRDAADGKPAMLEIRPGTGGDEAGLFAADLLRMYQRYCEKKGWDFDIIEEQTSEIGGIKEVTARVSGKNVFARLKYESGVHRVQRVPDTESGGRIHTSAATVAVLPEAEKIDIDIAPGDIRIDTMRASGAGGQHVNTTDSAVRITHMPSGIVVTSSQKSQHRNRELAMEVLRSRLFDMERSKIDGARSADRKLQIGSGDRSERIRTYNYPQGRLTDHRINLTLYRLDQIIAGDLDEIIDALAAHAQARLLAQMEEGG